MPNVAIIAMPRIIAISQSDWSICLTNTIKKNTGKMMNAIFKALAMLSNSLPAYLSGVCIKILKLRLVG